MKYNIFFCYKIEKCSYCNECLNPNVSSVYVFKRAWKERCVLGVKTPLSKMKDKDVRIYYYLINTGVNESLRNKL
jgi:hypothetical protein